MIDLLSFIFSQLFFPSVLANVLFVFVLIKILRKKGFNWKWFIWGYGGLFALYLLIFISDFVYMAILLALNFISSISMVYLRRLYSDRVEELLDYVISLVVYLMLFYALLTVVKMF